MKINREKQYSGGDHYPTVRAWMMKLGAAELDVQANATKVTVPEAMTWIARLRPRTKLTVRAMSGSEGRGGRLSITLDRRSFAAGTMSLGTVLHEIAHSLLAQRQHEYHIRRREARMAGKVNAPYQKVRPHGEEFCRIYARLLRDHVRLPMSDEAKRLANIAMGFDRVQMG